MLIHVVADYGAGDLAFAEVAQRFALHLPGSAVVPTPVPPFDTVSAGFCVAQLALTDGPADRVVFQNVAPRAESDDPRPGNVGERLVAARLASGVLVVGVDAGFAFSFLRDEAETMSEARLPDSGSQFRSRDVFPELVAALVGGDEGALGATVAPADVPAPPERALAYTDGYGNLKTTWPEPPAEPGTPLRVRVGDATAEAVAGGGTFEVPAGTLAFAPGSSGWSRRAGGERSFCELLLRGASAAERLGHPPAGAPVEVTPA